MGERLLCGGTGKNGILHVISFTEGGEVLAETLQKRLALAAAPFSCRLYTKCRNSRRSSAVYVEISTGAWAGERMESGESLLFIGACGIAVRAIAPYIKDKLRDSPVLVMDERGIHVIPLLAGHVGGANALAVYLGDVMQAVPVITTATDLNHRFSVDTFAVKNGLEIVNREGIAKVSAKVLAGERLTISVPTEGLPQDAALAEELVRIPYPPKQRVDILIAADESPAGAVLWLRPREYVLGLGCRKGKEEGAIRGLIASVLEEMGITLSQVAALATIDLKQEEPGIQAWCGRERIPLCVYSAEELNRVSGDFRESDFVRQTTGVGNVCERAALLACGPDGVLAAGKQAANGMTIAVARRKWRVTFEEEA